MPAPLAVSLCDTLLPQPGSLIEMAGPTVAAFRGAKTGVVIFATEATVHSELYQTGFRMIGRTATVVAVPELAGALEAGASQKHIRGIVERAVEGVSFESIDAAILACTHFPLAEDAFRAALPQHVHLFDPAAAVAARARKLWWPQEVGDGTLRFLISRDSAPFRGFVAELFPASDYSIEVVE